VSTLGGAFAQVVFKLTVTRALLIEGVLWACTIGVLGGLFPALRAARLPVRSAARGLTAWPLKRRRATHDPRAGPRPISGHRL